MYLGLKKSGISLEDAARFMGGTLCAPNVGVRFFGVSTDSRKTAAGDIFFALSGEKFDGENFAVAAVKAGAICAVVSRVPKENIPYILTDDTKKALGALAKNYYSLFPSLTVGITGSVGKTTTKEFVAAVLAEKYNTAKTEGNFNNEIGLPLTLLSFEPPKNALALEMGMSARGEISRLSKISRPDIGVITNIGSSHLENLHTRENIALAKIEIADGMADGSPLIMNGDEPLLKNPKNIQTNNIYVSLNDKNCEFFAYNIKEEPETLSFDCKVRENVFRNVAIPTTGRHNVYAALFAVAVGTVAGMDEEGIRRGLMKFTPCAMRGGISERGGIKIIEDCYNASPESMRAALDNLRHVAGSARKAAFLGEMRELGENSAKMHFEVGAYAAKSGVDILFTFGKNAKEIAKGALNAGFPRENIFVIEDTDDALAAAEKVKKIIKKGDVILFKASRALKLERISREI